MATATETWDGESLSAWLRTRPHRDGVAIAVRAACRVAPIALALPEPTSRERDIEGLAICWALLIAGVAVDSASPAITDAANNAFAAVYSGADKDATKDDVDAHARYAAAEAAFVAGNSTAPDYSVTAVERAAAAARAAEIWEQIREDALLLEAGADLLANPLWTISKPDWFRQADAEMRAIWRQDGSENWSFWLRWWDGVLSGRQIDWALQEKVALIPNEVWQQGPGAVARAIREFEGNDGSRASSEPTSLPRALERNRRAIVLQLDALLAFVSDEIDRLRGRNSYSRREHEEQQQRIEKLRQIIEAVTLMREAMDEEPSGSTALVVMDAQLPAVVEAADQSVSLGGEPQVSEVIATMATTIKHLTDNGTPGNYATAIAFAEFCWRKIAKWRKG